MRVMACGDKAVLVECPDAPTARRIRDELAEHWPTVLGANTVLVRTDAAKVRTFLAGLETPELAEPGTGRTHRIRVTYDGPDLRLVAEATGLSVAGVVEAHTSHPWLVGFAGFAPGFAYLVDGDPRLQVPRLEQPRTRVPAGAVGLAGVFSGIYPRESSGGWPLLGTTDVGLWDLGSSPPALLQPGDTVWFEAR